MKNNYKALFVIVLAFALVISSLFISSNNEARAKEKKNGEWEETLLISMPTSEQSIQARSSNINILTSYGLRYDKEKKKWYAYHKINYVIGGKPSSVKTTMVIQKKSSKKGKVTTYHTKSHTFKGLSIRNGAKYEYPVANSTGFYRKKFTVRMSSGGKSASRIVLDKKYVLFNKKLAKFPNYTDKWSGKVASNIRTDWKKGTKYKRGKTATIRKEYEKKYKVNVKWEKDKIELHHIKPVAYGGSSTLANYMAIPRAEHAKISKWFLSY